MAEEVAALHVTLTATTRQLEQRMARAEAQVARATASMSRGAAKADTALSRLGASMARGAGGRQFGNAIQQAGFQVGDFAVQVQGGQGVLRAFTQQGTQLISMFGPWGAVIGAAGAVVGALATSLLDAGDASEEADKSLDNLQSTAGALEGAVDSLIGVVEAYAEAITRSADASDRATARIIANTAREFEARKRITQFKNQEARAALMTSEQRAKGLQTQLSDIGAQEDQDAIAAQVRRELGIPKELADAGQAERVRSEVIDRMVSLAEQRTPIARELNLLTGEMELARIQLEESEELLGMSFEDLLADVQSGGSGSTKTGRRSGGGSARRERPQGDLFEGINDRIASLEQERTLIGLTEREQVRLNAAFERAKIVRELEAKASEDGTAITAEERAQINALAAEYEALTVAIHDETAALDAANKAAADAKERQEEAAKAVADLGDRISRAVQSADSFADALKNVAVELANVVAQAIAGQGPLASLFGGGGGGGGFLSSLFGGGSSSSVGTFIGSSGSGFAPGADVRFMHSGGVVGTAGMTRRVNPAVFAGAPRMHSGGIAGLKPDEVPTILQRGELVIPKGAANRASAPTINVNQPVTVNGSNLSPAEVSRAVAEGLARDRPKMLADVQRQFDRNGNYLRR